MKKFKLVLIIIAVLAAAGGLFAFLSVNYQDTHFITTDNATVSADMISVSPIVTGKLIEWNVAEGDFVKAEQILGRQDTGAMVSSSSVSPSALGSTAGAVAGKADIKSPIDGMVVQSSVMAGQMVGPGSSIVTIADMSHIYITANIEETGIFKIKEGQFTDISIDACPGKAFSGYVTRIGKVTNSVFNPFSNITTSGTFSKTVQYLPVYISITGSGEPELFPGFNATVKIHIQQ